MPNEPVLVDTGALASLFNPSDQYHRACAEVAKGLPVGKAYTCWPVITEATYLLRRHPAKRDSLLVAVEAGELQLLSLDVDDLHHLLSIFDKYRDQQIDLADAVLLHLADREDIDDVFTVNRRHFSIFRKRDGSALRLFPSE
ncbi:MAG: type II toxin-antitoxin system VapC family toxin [Pirellulales bacterium]